ncbi:MAG: hypothetical protein B6D61_06460 [Bacteroidetes bacterium 4484_249]|nr:MAG: hypothetical protein B6D61_06460 [Bacteroidetes bacterium 4484_249]
MSDIVLNDSLATEGNMSSLDFIPGSNFLGVVASEYKSITDTYDIFHSGKVSFGDALIFVDNKKSYTLPFCLFTDKLKNDIVNDTVWVHHGINEFDIIGNGKNLQLKQQRAGFINTDGVFIKKVEKKFALKSAYNAEERRSKEGAMFGFDAIKKGQEFIFSVIFKDEKHVNLVSENLTGIKHIGKSKTAEYGLVDISTIGEVTEFKSRPSTNGYLVVYAESNLCFLDENGQPTFQPDAGVFYVNGKILWEKSQIRTYSYSPWNAKRNAANTQRDVILKGSVIVIKLNDGVNSNNLQKQVGEYTAEGLGRVIYNPEFFEYDANNNGEWKFKVILFEKPNAETFEKADIKSALGKILQHRKQTVDTDLEIGNKIIEVLSINHILSSPKITKSQWGAIRTFAMQSSTIEELELKLFDDPDGYLMHGVAAERIWDYKNGKRRSELKKVILANKELGTKFVTKLAAEFAKKNTKK